MHVKITSSPGQAFPSSRNVELTIGAGESGNENFID